MSIDLAAIRDRKPNDQGHIPITPQERDTLIAAILTLDQLAIALDQDLAHAHSGLARFNLAG